MTIGGFTRRRVVAALAVVTALVVAGAAVAYFTSSGSGTRSASVGSSSAVTLLGTVTGAPVPAGAPAGVSVLVTNPGSGSEFVNAVHLANITTDADHSDCVTTVGAAPRVAFTMADIPVAQTLTGTGTTNDHVTVTGALRMNDTLVDQDNYMGATLTLTFSSN
jgi:hypothetical protein